MKNSLEEKFYLLIGGASSESTTSKIKAEGSRYKRKLLESGPENWRKIIDILNASGLEGVLAVLTGNDYAKIMSAEYADVAVELVKSLSKVPHIVLVHENVYLSNTERLSQNQEDNSKVESLADIESQWDDVFSLDELFVEIPEEMRLGVNQMLASYKINALSYRTNAERSILAGKFLEDLERHLLFRIYVPQGRLYAEEADVMISLFRDWLNQTGRNVIRQDGYITPAGQVYEFFANTAQDSSELNRQFEDFSHFINSCIEDPGNAVEILTSSGVDIQIAPRLVSRYGKAGRRLQIDLRQSREQRLLTLKHQFEAELWEDEETALSIESLLGTLVSPKPITWNNLVSGISTDTRTAAPSIQINLNQQFIESSQGAIIQNLEGTAHLGIEAKEILHLIRQYGEENRAFLESALHELEDEEARKPERIVARQRLIKFISEVGKQASTISVSLLQEYLQQRLGL
ncbi:hypothetical protein [Corynebacterium glutamicum]|uniref:hypothetical protein n=1 Tax=Corynebacterium glutamicum TaxID=1718 RepID=UPI0009434388|nr:hypothetical protein [Corynebacterium glutamicum]OKX88122.1 hypothetical protein AUO96_03805 [Corynebacterium glutamicum]QDX74827.1 hypothetical protein AKL15_03230 [Corynebacterium glutamicum]QDX77590.1 hypothetical protein AKL16_03230 [Corynebacterium glutamicum]TWS33818.1 hypothetical protein AKJ20_08880 [Corynebacterium glutamicum]TWS34285.1 hypothetical protein AKJ19_07130 [Corynebacterium glutamicum]